MHELDSIHSRWLETSLLRAVHAKPFGRLLHHTIASATPNDVLGELYLRLRSNTRFMNKFCLTPDYEAAQRLVHHVAKLQVRGPIKRLWQIESRAAPKNYLSDPGKFRNGKPLSAASVRTAEWHTPTIPKLSRIELRILKMKLGGISQRDIAEHLGVSTKTVQRHLAELRKRVRSSKKETPH